MQQLVDHMGWRNRVQSFVGSLLQSLTTAALDDDTCSVCHGSGFVLDDGDDVTYCDAPGCSAASRNRRIAASRLAYLTTQNRLPSQERGERPDTTGEPTCKAEWEARLEADDADMRAYEATLPPPPDTSAWSLRDASYFFARAVYGGFPMQQVPERVREEWSRQWHEEFSPERYPR